MVHKAEPYATWYAGGCRSYETPSNCRCAGVPPDGRWRTGDPRRGRHGTRVRRTAHVSGQRQVRAQGQTHQSQRHSGCRGIAGYGYRLPGVGPSLSGFRDGAGAVLPAAAARARRASTSLRGGQRDGGRPLLHRTVRGGGRTRADRARACGNCIFPDACRAERRHEGGRRCAPV